MSIYIPCAILLLLFLYVNLTITMNPLSSKVHFLAQTRQTKRRTNRTGRTENQHERANSAPKSRACADVIQLCHYSILLHYLSRKASRVWGRHISKIKKNFLWMASYNVSDNQIKASTPFHLELLSYYPITFDGQFCWNTYGVSL